MGRVGDMHEHKRACTDWCSCGMPSLQAIYSACMRQILSRVVSARTKKNEKESKEPVFVNTIAWRKETRRQTHSPFSTPSKQSSTTWKLNGDIRLSLFWNRTFFLCEDSSNNVTSHFNVNVMTTNISGCPRRKIFCSCILSLTISAYSYEENTGRRIIHKSKK